MVEERGSGLWLLLKAGKDLGRKRGNNRCLVGMLQSPKCFHDTDAFMISNLAKLLSTESSLMIHERRKKKIFL